MGLNFINRFFNKCKAASANLLNRTRPVTSNWLKATPTKIKAGVQEEKLGTLRAHFQGQF